MNALIRRFARVTAAVTAATAASFAVAQDENSDTDAAYEAKEGMVYASMKTSHGTMILELNEAKAPISVENFLAYAEDDFYDGTIFHRVMSNFMIQGGGFTADMEKKDTRDPIKNEWENGLKNVRGSIAMARLGGQADSATSQFFINVVDNAALDTARDGSAYAVFGRVIAGMDTADRIREVPTGSVRVGDDPRAMMQNVPNDPVVIEDVSRIEASNLEDAIAKAKSENEAAIAEAEKRAAEQVAMMEKQIADHLAKYDASVEDAVETESGLRYVIVKEGEGASPDTRDTVRVHYTGWLTDGTKFDSSHDRGDPLEFPLNRVIPGWTEGVGAMKVGGRRFLIIPPAIGYGARGAGNVIPPNATLIFDVELLGIPSKSE
ncbi:MAG: peptidylprolyl isomerase [Phycisphaerales bacterium]